MCQNLPCIKTKVNIMGAFEPFGENTARKIVRRGLLGDCCFTTKIAAKVISGRYVAYPGKWQVLFTELRETDSADHQRGKLPNNPRPT